MENKRCLLLLDPQNDFMDPSGNFRKFTEIQVNKIFSYLYSNMKNFDSTVVMLDSHYPNDINHSSYWIDFEGDHPKPGTILTHKEVKGRKYSVNMKDVPREVFEQKQKMATEYIENLQSVGKKHTIYPTHAVIGTWGHNIYTPILDLLLEQAKERGRDYQVVLKGLYQHAEHFGAFEAEVPNPQVPETMLNQGILQFLDHFDDVYAIGHEDVLYNSLCQLTSCAEHLNAPDIIERYVVLTDSEKVLSYCKEKNYRTQTNF